MLKRQRRRRQIVIFLDANILGLMVAEYLWDLRGVAYWISFWSPQYPPRHNRNSKKSSRRKVSYSPRDQRLLRHFFDLLGDKNVLDRNGIAPHRMKDQDLLSYMAGLMKQRYLDRDFYLFFTHDKGFIKQPAVQNNPDFKLITKGKLTPVIIEQENGLSVMRETARQIREFLEVRLNEDKV